MTELSPTAWLLLPLFLHFGLVVGLYTALTLARPTAVRRGEAPVFAWIAALLLILTSAVTAWDVAAAWVFLIGRLIHTAAQCLGDNVALRGQVFTINFLGLLWLMAHAFLAILGVA